MSLAHRDVVVGQWVIRELRRHGYEVSPGTLYPPVRRRLGAEALQPMMRPPALVLPLARMAMEKGGRRPRPSPPADQRRPRRSDHRRPSRRKRTAANTLE